MQALTRKIPLGSDVNLDHYAEITEGFSGADIQALLYNAHLEVVHLTLGGLENNGTGEPLLHPTQVQYQIYNPLSKPRVTSKADHDAMLMRVSAIILFIP